MSGHLLPIVVWGDGHEKWGVDNIIAALKHSDPICQFVLFELPSSQLEKILAAMQQPFPVLRLTRLRFQHRDETAPVHPASFLGGSAPRLQSLMLHRIPFPGLPNLLLSTTHLVALQLWKIPHSGYFSPEAIATGPSVLTNLESLDIRFESRRSRPDR
jgi:hypothetical protein